MEAATEIPISYNSKVSNMFSQECVGGPKNGSSKLAWRAARQKVLFYLSWKRGSFDYNQECTEHGFTGVNSKSARRATRPTAIKLHRSTQQNNTQECNGAHYVLCRSQE